MSNKSQPQARRDTTISSRATNRLSTMKTQGTRSDKSVDSRNSRDPQTIQQSSNRVYDFFMDIGFENTPSVKLLTEGVSLKHFLDMINALNDLLATQIKSCPSDSKDYDAIYSFISLLAGQLAYPDNNMIKKTDLKSCSQSQTWRKFLLFLVWLVELCDFAMHVDMDGEEQTKEQNVAAPFFIKSLCQAEDPQTMLQGPQYFDFVSQMYKEYIANNDQQLTQIEAQFDLWREEAARAENRLASEVHKIDSDMQRRRKLLENELDTARSELSFAAEYDTRYQLNMGQGSVLHSSNIVEEQGQQISVSLLVDIKQKNLDKLNGAIQILEAQIMDLENNQLPTLQTKRQELTTSIEDQMKQQQELRDKMAVLSKQVEQQDMSYQNFQKLQFTHSTLKLDFQNLQQEYDIAGDKLKKQGETKSMLQREIMKISEQVGVAADTDCAKLQQNANQLRKETATLERETTELSKERQQLVTEFVQMENNLKNLQQQLDAAKQREEVFKEDHERQLKEVQYKAMQMTERLKVAQKEVHDLIDEKKKYEFELEQQTTTLQQKSQAKAREQARSQAEMAKLEAIVGNILQKILDSRKKARDQLDMVRDKVGEALQAVQQQ